MPIILDFAESQVLPNDPVATDINPERFGRDAAALASLGGELGSLGSKLMKARKEAIEADAVATAQTEDTIAFSKMEDEARREYQAAADAGVAGTTTMSDKLREKTSVIMQERLKSMPTGDAQRMYEQRMQPVADRAYLQNTDWENQTRSKSIVDNIQKRANIAAQDIYNAPSFEKASLALNALKEDINKQRGVSIMEQDADKAYKVLGHNQVSSLFDGLASSGNPDDIKKGRALLNNMPPQMKELVDGQDLRTFENRLQEGEREQRSQSEINLQLERRALEDRRNVAQDQLLQNIYDGKSSINDILRGTGKELDPDKKQTMINILKARVNEPAIPNPANLKDVVMRIHAEDGDPDKIVNQDQVLKLYAKGNLTWDQKQKALTELKQNNSIYGQVEAQQKKQLFKQAQAALVRPNAMGIADPDGEENQAKFMSYAYKQMDEQRKAGKPMSELLDANSPKYLGNSIREFSKTPQQILKSQADRVRSQSLAAQKQAVQAPKDTVMVLDPNGKQFYVPKQNLDKALARGYKRADVGGGRRPQSLSEPRIELVKDGPAGKKTWRIVKNDTPATNESDSQIGAANEDIPPDAAGAEPDQQEADLIKSGFTQEEIDAAIEYGDNEGDYGFIDAQDPTPSDYKDYIEKAQLFSEVKSSGSVSSKNLSDALDSGFTVDEASLAIKYGNKTGDYGFLDSVSLDPRDFVDYIKKIRKAAK